MSEMLVPPAAALAHQAALAAAQAAAAQASVAGKTADATALKPEVPVAEFEIEEEFKKYLSGHARVADFVKNRMEPEVVNNLCYRDNYGYLRPLEIGNIHQQIGEHEQKRREALSRSTFRGMLNGISEDAGVLLPGFFIGSLFAGAVFGVSHSPALTALIGGSAFCFVNFLGVMSFGSRNAARVKEADAFLAGARTYLAELDRVCADPGELLRIHPEIYLDYLKSKLCALEARWKRHSNESRTLEREATEIGAKIRGIELKDQDDLIKEITLTALRHKLENLKSAKAASDEACGILNAAVQAMSERKQGYEALIGRHRTQQQRYEQMEAALKEAKLSDGRVEEIRKELIRIVEDMVVMARTASRFEQGLKTGAELDALEKRIAVLVAAGR